MKSQITLIITIILFAFGTTNAQTTVFSEDFEGGGLGPFTASNGIGNHDWHNTQFRANDPGHSSTSSAYFGDSVANDYGGGFPEAAVLSSGAIDLTGYNVATLSFNYFLETEGLVPYDIAKVVVSNGLLTLEIANNQGTAPAALSDPSNTWQTFTADISAFAGSSTVTIAFDFNTVDPSLNDFEGWYVDDVTVVAFNNGCTVQVTTTSTPESSTGANDGTGTAIVTGGTPPYTYLWSDPSSQTNVVATGLAPGTYTVTVLDADTCSTTATITVLPAGLGCNITLTVTSTDETQAGMDDGTATVFATGGTTPYFYLWSDAMAQTTNTAFDLPAGIYTVTVTDNDSCVAIATVVIQPGPGGCAGPNVTFLYTVNGMDVSFVEGSVVSGPAQYAWDFDDGNGSLTQNPTYTYGFAGTFNVCLTVTDTCGTTTFCQPVIVTGGNNCTLTVSTSSTDETAPFSFDGTATAIPANGNPPYIYLWNDPSAQTTATAVGLIAGIYTVTVIDGDSCVATGTAIVQIAGCNMTISSISTDETSAGASDGTASVTVAGGTPPYAYLWSNGETSSSQVGMFPGVYTVVVNDGMGCIVSDTIIILPAGGGCNLVLVASSTDESIAGMNDGTATAFVSNGTSPYNYLWSDGQTSAFATGLAPGVYTVTVTDADQCTAIATVVIMAGGVNCQIQISITVVNQSQPGVNDGSATAVVTGGTQPYVYIWNTGATTSAITGLAPGVYNCWVTDADSCIAGGTGVVQSFVCDLTGTMSSTDETSLGAFDGTASVAASAGTPPYNYSWSNFATTSSISGLAPGIWDVTVTDAMGCTYSASAAVNPGGFGCNLTATMSGDNESQAGFNDGTATVTIGGGTAPVFVQWANLDTGTTISGLAPGDYTVVLTDAMGCFATGTYTVMAGLIIGVLDQPQEVLSVVVYPNPAVDAINFEISGIDAGRLLVFDFSGKLMNEIDVDQSLTNLNTSNLKSGIYFYQLLTNRNDKIGSGKFVIQR